METETSSRGWAGNPNSPPLQTTYRRWNRRRGVRFFGWIQEAQRTCTSTVLIPGWDAHMGLQWVSWAIYEKGKGQEMSPTYTEHPKFMDYSLTHGLMENQTHECVDMPFTPLWSVWVSKKRGLGELMGFSLPLPQSLWLKISFVQFFYWLISPLMGFGYKQMLVFSCTSV